MSHTSNISHAWLIRWYWAVFNFIASDRLKQNDLDPRVMHAHLITVLCTGIFMWTYVVISFVFMSSAAPKIISLVASIIHLLTPLLFRFSNRVFVIANIMLAAGMSHQLVSAVYSGGFNSYILIWFGILPTLAGIITGMRGLMVWATITTSVCATLLIMDVSGFDFPGNGAGNMTPIFQSIMVFGWIFINAIMMYAHLIMQQRYEQKLAAQHRNVSMLLKVMTHDMSPPLASISAATWALKADKNALERHIDNIEIASQSLTDMTKRVQQMYLLANEPLNINKQRYCVADCASVLLSLFNAKLDHKSLNFNYDPEELSKIYVCVDPGVFTHQIMANLLSNAIKFSYESGEITLEAAQDNDFVKITLTDGGVGIPSEKLEHLFTVEKNISTPGTASELGLGYGLTIVKTFVKGFGGEINAISPPPEKIDKPGNTSAQGTCFTITLPKG